MLAHGNFDSLLSQVLSSGQFKTDNCLVLNCLSFILSFFCRYKRRGIDENGHVANYVETEQILSFGEHQMAFVQVRGSIPVYWSQPGFKYRPKVL